MELTDFVGSEILLNRMETALENKEYHTIGQILEGFDTYTRLFKQDVERDNNENHNIVSNYILMDLPDTERNIQSLLRDINYMYKDIGMAKKRIRNDPFQPRIAYRVLADYYEPILEQIALHAINEFKSIVKSVNHYNEYIQKLV